MSIQLFSYSLQIKQRKTNQTCIYVWCLVLHGGKYISNANIHGNL